MADVDVPRAAALELPRTEEHLARDRVKFKVGRIAHVALSPDEAVMGFAYPREERDALADSEPDTLLPPSRGDARYHWVQARLERLAAEQALRMDHDRSGRIRR